MDESNAFIFAFYKSEMLHKKNFSSRVKNKIGVLENVRI